MLTARITDANGNTIGDGPLTTIISATLTKRLDQAGSFSITVPAGDYRAANYPQTDYQIRVLNDGAQIFRGIIRKRSYSPGSGVGSFNLTGPDLMEEMRSYTVGMNRDFNGVALETAVATLAALAGWTSAVTGGYSILAKFSGASALAAILECATKLGLHVRQSTSVIRQLEMGPFGASLGVTLVNPERVTAELADNKSVAIVDRIELIETSSEVTNWMIPLGGGQGQAQLNLAKSTRSAPYTITSSTGPDGNLQYSISDLASIARYGVREGVFVSHDISPLSNSDADVANAANALYDKAVAYLARNKDKQVAYKVSVKNLTGVQVGDQVRLLFLGYVTQGGQPVDYLHVDANFYVMGITTHFDTSGAVAYDLEISNVDKLIRDDTQIVLDQLQQLQVMRAIPQPTACKSNYVRYEEMDSAHSVKVPINITNATLYLNRCQFTFKTRPFRSTAAGGAGGGDHRHLFAAYQGTTASTFGLQKFNISNDGTGLGFSAIGIDTGYLGDLYTNSSSGNHTHPQLYGISDDTQYPQTITILVDGVDLTTALGGAWALLVGGVNVTLDLTSYLNNASGGLRQEHTVEIRCGSGQGIVETLVELFEIVQAIVVQ